MTTRILLRDDGRGRWLEFTRPVQVLQAMQPDEVLPVLQAIERRVNEDGLHAAGYVAYEAAAGFDAAFQTADGSGKPLLSFGLYSAPAVLARLAPPPVVDAVHVAWSTDTPRDRYLQNIAGIHEQIALGNTYQVNYTIRALAEGTVDPWGLFLSMALDAPYAAYIEADDYAIVSASPELFFELDGDRVVGKPMKGTARRGMTQQDDSERRAGLQVSVKDRAENVMIADMIRNDLGRIALPGSVATRDLYRVEKYPTVWQMTSTVEARTHASVARIFAALFPCASVTGAPKVASMRHIVDLETTPRHVYTGAIGRLSPGRQARFSVAIRTAYIDRRQHRASYGIGSGIVWNSTAEAEYEECLAKAQVLCRPPRPDRFRLLETLLWTRADGYFLLDRHLARLHASAAYFDFNCDVQAVRQALDERVQASGSGRSRVRLLLDVDGTLDVTAETVGASESVPQSLRLATVPVDANDPFIYHKTTWRDGYARARRDAGDCDDVLLWNRDGYITETTIANVLVRRNGRLCTPPLRCGLLAGTYREWLLDTGRAEERPIHESEIRHGAEIVLCNSVRGEYAAVVLRDSAIASSG